MKVVKRWPASAGMLALSVLLALPGSAAAEAGHSASRSTAKQSAPVGGER